MSQNLYPWKSYFAYEFNGIIFTAYISYFFDQVYGQFFSQNT
jgi:hypothetical protein